MVFVNILLHTQGQGCDESICDLEGHVGTNAMKDLNLVAQVWAHRIYFSYKFS
jgi:hypothetical protein